MPKRRGVSKRLKGVKPRIIDTRDVRERFLIVCEGERTEPNYFRKFRVPRDVVTIQGVGHNTVSLVKKAIELSEKESYDQIWCVFDKDSFPAKNFNEAIALAQSKKIRIAYSNEAFELWYLLHFNYCDVAISRSAYKDKLSRLLSVKYEKNREDMYELLLSKQPHALRNAEKLHNQYNPHKPDRDNPCTLVYLLVEQLNRFIIN